VPEEPTGAGNQKETAQESLEVQTLNEALSASPLRRILSTVVNVPQAPTVLS
jgi:hypothetical protein